MKTKNAFAMQLALTGLLAACGGGGTGTDTTDTTDTDTTDTDVEEIDAAVPDAAPPDAEPAICAVPGAATLTGSVGAIDLDVVGALQIASKGFFIAVHEAGATCDGPNGAGYMMINFCAAPAPGEFTVLADALDCVNTPDGVTIQMFPPGNIKAVPADADSGTVTIHGEIEGCDEGSFDVLFGADEVTGSFSATECPAAPPV